MNVNYTNTTGWVSAKDDEKKKDHYNNPGSFSTNWKNKYVSFLQIPSILHKEKGRYLLKKEHGVLKDTGTKEIFKEVRYSWLCNQVSEFSFNSYMILKHNVKSRSHFKRSSN